MVVLCRVRNVCVILLLPYPRLVSGLSSLFCLLQGVSFTCHEIARFISPAGAC